MFNVGVVETHFYAALHALKCTKCPEVFFLYLFFIVFFWFHSLLYPWTYNLANWLPRRHFIFYFAAEVIIVMRSIAV